MLRKIEIQNYAIIDHLSMEFHPGMTTVTGETGAGKSILLGALGLVMGDRADTKVLFDSEKKCFVEAIFDVRNYGLKEYFDQNDLEYDDELTIRREISQTGKGRAFVNDSPVTLDILTDLSESLIDIHQQFDTRDLQRNQYQIDILDALAGNKDLVNKYRTLHKSYIQSSKKLEELKTISSQAMQEMEFLNFQLQEIDALELVAGEMTDIENQQQVLESAEEIKTSTTLISHTLMEDENAIVSVVQSLYQQLNSVKNLDPRYLDLHDRLVAVREELADIAKESEKIAEVTDHDPEKIQQNAARLSIIYRLLKKHNVVNDIELLTLRDNLQQKLSAFDDISGNIDKLEKDCAKSLVELKQIGANISKARVKAAPKIADDIHKMLVSLSMEHAYIKYDIQPSESIFAHGTDQVNLLFSPNKGSEFLPIKGTASGGEQSRLALCIKSLTAGAMTLPTLIFDEIDAGVSGEVAHKMGQILKKLSTNHQLMCITHSPQIASKGDSHYWVYKQDTDKRTLTALRQLDGEERINEIAKMLSGNPPSPAAIANAKELLAIS